MGGTQQFCSQSKIGKTKGYIRPPTQGSSYPIHPWRWEQVSGEVSAPRIFPVSEALFMEPKRSPGSSRMDVTAAARPASAAPITSAPALGSPLSLLLSLLLCFRPGPLFPQKFIVLVFLILLINGEHLDSTFCLPGTVLFSSYV